MSFYLGISHRLPIVWLIYLTKKTSNKSALIKQIVPTVERLRFNNFKRVMKFISIGTEYLFQTNDADSLRNVGQLAVVDQLDDGGHTLCRAVDSDHHVVISQGHPIKRI